MTPEPPSTRAILGAVAAIAVLTGLTSVGARWSADHTLNERAPAPVLELGDQTGSGQPVAGVVFRRAHRPRVTSVLAATTPTPPTEFWPAGLLLSNNDLTRPAGMALGDVATRGPPIPTV